MSKKSRPIGTRQFAGEVPAQMLTRRVSVGAADTSLDVNVTALGVQNLFEIVAGLHIHDIKVFKKDGLSDSGTGTSTGTLGDTGDADRFFTDTTLAGDASGWVSLAVDGVTKTYRYSDTEPGGTYIGLTVGASIPTDGELLFDFIYSLKEGVSEDYDQ